MRRAAVLSLMFLLCWSLLPGGTELAENVYHLSVHGDFAHSEPLRRGHTPFSAEHGCGGGFHLCSCCHNILPSLSESKPHFVAERRPSEAFTRALLVPHPQDFFPLPEEPPRS